VRRKAESILKMDFCVPYQSGSVVLKSVNQKENYAADYSPPVQTADV
jgi:hypothetical protein